jgi:alkylated DNA repair dioxygenase AlkB
MNESVTPNLLRYPSGDEIHLPPNGRLAYHDGWIEPVRADRLFEEWMSALDWRQRPIMLFGREIMQPRLTCFYGEAGMAYRYSGKTLKARAWDGELRALAEELRESLDEDFNSVLCNLYRDGQDSMGWHADNEPALGSNPVIASVSLGAVRRFRLKPRGQGKARSLSLGHGSLLVMSGDLQHHWLHELPKSRRVDGPRINLTFRRIR